jgi:predicted AlkP superfamily phosphohydrolase/phosphomutase
MLVDDYISSPSLLITKLFDDKLGDERNTHELKGIFLAYGHDIKKGAEIQNAKIYDLAPTILHLMDVSIPKDMDGKVLKEIFKEDSELAKREIKYQEADEKEMVKEKIKDLKKSKKI